MRNNMMFTQFISDNPQSSQPMRADLQFQQPLRNGNQYNQPMRNDDRYNQPMRNDDHHNQPMRNDNPYNQPMKNDFQFQQPMRNGDHYNQPMRADLQFVSHTGQTLGQDGVKYNAMKGSESSSLAQLSLRDEIKEVQMEDVPDFDEAARDSRWRNSQHVQQTTYNSLHFLNHDITNMILQPNCTSQTPVLGWGQGVSMQYLPRGWESNQSNANIQSNPRTAANPFHGVQGMPIGKSGRTRSNSATLMSIMGDINQENINNCDKVKQANYLNGCNQYNSNGTESYSQSHYTQHRVAPRNKSKRLVERVRGVRDMGSKDEMMIYEQVQHSSLAINMPPVNVENSDEDLYVAVKRLNQPDPTSEDFYIDWAEISDNETYPIPTTDRSEFVPVIENLRDIKDLENPSRDLIYQSSKRRHESGRDLNEENMSRSVIEGDDLDSYLCGMIKGFQAPDSVILPNKRARRRRSRNRHKDESTETHMLDYSLSFEHSVTRKAEVSVDNSRQSVQRTENAMSVSKQVPGYTNKRTHNEMEFESGKKSSLIPQDRGVISKVCRVESRTHHEVIGSHGGESNHGQTKLINISTIKQQHGKETFRRHAYGSGIPDIYAGPSKGNRSEENSTCLTRQPNQQVLGFDKGLNPTGKRRSRSRRNRPNPQKRQRAKELALEGQEHPAARNGILSHPNNQVGTKALIASTDNTKVDKVTDIPYHTTVRSIWPNTGIGYNRGNENKSSNSNEGKNTTDKYEGYLTSVNGAFPPTKCMICGRVTIQPIRHLNTHLPKILHDDMLCAKFLDKSVSHCIVQILVYLKQVIMDKKKSFLQLRKFIDGMGLIDPHLKDKSVSDHYTEVMKGLCRFQGWEIPNVFTIVPLNSNASLIHWQVLEICVASLCKKQRKDFLSYCYQETFHLLSKSIDGRDGSCQSKSQKKEKIPQKDKGCVNSAVNNKQVNVHTKAQSIATKPKKTECINTIKTLDKIGKESTDKKKTNTESKDIQTKNVSNKSTEMIDEKSTQTVEKNKKDFVPPTKKNTKYAETPEKSKGTMNKCSSEKSTFPATKDSQINSEKKENAQLDNVPIVMEMEIPDMSETPAEFIEKHKPRKLTNVPLVVDVETCIGTTKAAPEITDSETVKGIDNSPILVVDLETCIGTTKAAPEIKDSESVKSIDNSPIKYAGDTQSPGMNTIECVQVSNSSISPITITVNIPKYDNVNSTEIMKTGEANISEKSTKLSTSKDEFNENTRHGLHQTPVVDIKHDFQSAMKKLSDKDTTAKLHISHVDTESSTLQSATTTPSDEDGKAKLHKTHVDTESSTCVGTTKETMNEIQQMSHTDANKLGINIEIEDDLPSKNSMDGMGDSKQLMPGSGDMNTEMDTIEVFSITMDASLSQNSPSVSDSLSETKCSNLTKLEDQTRLVKSGTDNGVDQVVKCADNSETSVSIAIEPDANTTNKDHNGGKDKATNSPSTKCVVNIEIGDVSPLDDTQIEQYKAITIPVAELIVLEEARSSNSNKILNDGVLNVPAMNDDTDLFTANSSCANQTELDGYKELLNETFTARYSDPTSYPRNLSADMIYAIGVNPIYAQALTEERFEQFERLLHHKSTRALGDLGLDWTTPENTWSLQATVFKQVLEFCTARKAVFLTLRAQHGDSGAYKKAFDMMQEFCGSNQSILLDEFCGGEDVVKTWLGKFRNCYFGFSKNIHVFTPKELLVLKMIPLDRIVLEYGCQNCFSKENEIQSIDDVKVAICVELSKVAKIVANTLGMSVKEFVRISNENRCRLLHI